ncbi:MAG: Cgl0159 family (beta/alpha)8-fold protein, partial [Nocardioidaceae bacterium]
ETFDRWHRALKLPAVQGMIVGRALLYPPDGDVAAAVDKTVELL